MRVYLSSTFKDLVEHRSAVVHAIRRCGLECAAMEDYTAGDERPLNKCLLDVAASDIYIGIFAHRYGYIPKGHTLSITDLEYRKALEEKKPILCFLVDPKHPWVPDFIDTPHSQSGKRLKQLKEHLCDSHLIDFFRTPDHLSSLVSSALSSLIARLDLGRQSKEGELSVIRPLQHLRFRARNFTGREAELAELETSIRATLLEGNVTAFVGIRGVGGVGKSALAAELAERLSLNSTHVPGGVLWTDLRTEKATDACARWLRSYRVDCSQCTSDEIISKFHQVAAQRQPLIVIDNVQDRADVEVLLVNAKGVVNLLTTRDQQHIPPSVATHRVGELTEIDALNLLSKFIPQEVTAERMAAMLVCAQCGYLPVFLQVAGAAVQAKEFNSLSEYAAELEMRGLKSLADHDHHVAEVFEVSWESLSKSEQELFCACSFFPGGDFGVHFVSSLFENDDRQARKMLARLENASLINRASDRRYRFHDRVRDFAQGKVAHPSTLHPRLAKCWGQYAFVKAELIEVGAYELARQYLRLRSGENLPNEFHEWYQFIHSQTHVLGQRPELFFQQAFNAPRSSTPSIQAQQIAKNGKLSESWIEWMNRPEKFTTGEPRLVFSGHKHGATDLVLHPDQRTAISCGWLELVIRVWDTATGEQLRVFSGHSDRVQAVAVNAGGNRVVSGGRDGNVIIWDFETGEEVSRMKGSAGGDGFGIGSVAIDGTASRVLFTVFDKITVWDTRSGKTRKLSGHAEWIYSVAISRDGRIGISGGYDHTVRVWDLETGELKKTLTHDGWVMCVMLSSDSETIISGGGKEDDYRLRVWNSVTGQQIRVLEVHSDIIDSLAFTKDETCLLSASRDGTVKAWNLDNGYSATIIEGQSYGFVTLGSIAVTNDCKMLITASSNEKTVKVWDLEQPQQRCDFEGHRELVRDVDVSHDGTTFVSSASDHTVRIWEARTGRKIAILDGHEREVLGVAVSADATLIVSASAAEDHSSEDIVRVWDVDTRRIRHELKHKVARAVAISLDKTIIVSGSNDWSIRIWDARSGECKRTLQGPRGWVTWLALTPDAKRLVSRSQVILEEHSTVALWDVDSGMCLGSFRDDSEEAMNVLKLVEPDRSFKTTIVEDGVEITEKLSGNVVGHFPGEFSNATCTFDGRFAILGAQTGRIWLVKRHSRRGN